MVETTNQAATTPETATIPEQAATTITTIASELNEDELTSLDIYEGAITGMFYVETETGYRRGEVTKGGLRVTEVTDPDEDLDELARIEPDEGETVQDAVDNFSFSGD